MNYSSKNLNFLHNDKTLSKPSSCHLSWSYMVPLTVPEHLGIIFLAPHTH